MKTSLVSLIVMFLFFLLGDFNSVFDRSLDRSDSSIVSSPRDTSDKLIKLFADFIVVDVWRCIHPQVKSFTWTRPDGSFLSRIDLIGVPSTWSCFAVSCDILACPHSDHCAVALSINIPSPAKLGPGFWKLNLSILTDPEYVECIHNFWSCWRLQKHLYNNLLLWWDLAKQWIRTLTIRFCSLLNRSKRSERANLEKQIRNLKIQIDAGNSSVIPQYKQLLDQLAKLDAHQAEGLRVRSRVQWAEENESSSAFFFKTIKKRRSDNTIFVVKNNSDQYICSTPDLLNAWQEFFVNLFTAVPTDEDLQNIL